MIPDYVTTFEVWSNYPVVVGEVVGDLEVVEVLPPLSSTPSVTIPEPFPPGRWIGRTLNREKRG